LFRDDPGVPTLLWTGAGILLSAGASFFFALAESALFALTKWQVRQLAEQSPKRGAAVRGLLERPQDVLATIVLGNTIANAAIIALALAEVLEHGLAAGWAALAVVGVFVLIVVGCEVLPKTLAVRAPERWSLRVAGLIAVLLRLSSPFHGLAQRMNAWVLRAALRSSIQPQAGLTDAEYRELMELAYQQGTIAQSEKEIILQIIGLDQRTVREVMKPRSQVACLPDDLSIEEMIEAARRHRHRRLPLYDESPDTIVGVLNTRALLLDPQADLADAIEFPSFVPASMNLLRLLRSLQRQQRGLAIVLDEFGGMAGIVTTEDILSEMVGELQGEGEAQGFVMEKLGEGRWRVSASMRVDDFRREHPPLGEIPEVDTLGGLVLHATEMVPAVGETCVFRGLRFKVTAGDERRVTELVVERTDKRGGG
jgi:putative hemolysin